jgi:MFS family permease
MSLARDVSRANRRDLVVEPEASLDIGDQVYQIENTREAAEGTAWLSRRNGSKPRVSRNVVYLGVNSMLTDISSEMVSTILPLYLLFGLRLAPLQFGVIDGLYQGGAVLVRLVSGYFADRGRNPKLVAVVGYGLSGLCRIGFLLVRGPWLAITGLVMLDRVGKGIRTAPRDAIISLSTAPSGLGTAFGVHRALDTAGAMIGPLLAFGILAIAPGSFESVFVVSFFFALCGLTLLVLLVKNPKPQPQSNDAAERTLPVRITPKDASRLLNTPAYKSIVFAGAALSLVTVSDTFIYLSLQDQLDFDVSFFPLLFVATALVYMTLAVPFGRLSDRIGRAKVFLAGYGILAAAYATLLLPSVAPFQFLVSLVLLGAYYAMTEGVLNAFASTAIPAELRGTGLGLLSTATGLGRLFGSVIFGAVWGVWGIQVAVFLFFAGLLLTLVLATVMLRPSMRGMQHA